jgi:E3 ubiquitin-protein ligase TRIP12
MASFLASCFSSKDQPALVIDALQMTELLLTKVPDTYQYFFRREGVMHELEKMAAEPYVVVKPKSKKGKATAGTSTTSTPGNATPQFGMASPVDDGGDAVDLGTRIALAAGGVGAAAAARATTIQDGLIKDSITLRAQHLKRMLKESSAMDGSLKADSELNKIRALVKKLSDVAGETGTSAKDVTATEKKAKAALASLATLLTSGNIMSSFEMQESGLIGGLLRFTSSSEGTTRRSTALGTFVASG